MTKFDNFKSLHDYGGKLPEKSLARHWRLGVAILWIPLVGLLVIAAIISGLLRFLGRPFVSKSACRDPEQHVIQKAYAHWAPIYDIVWGPIFANARRVAARAASEIGGRILEIGVGTGLSLGDYHESTQVIGIDLSAPMIARAKARMADHQYFYVEDLVQMDAAYLDFDNQSFDCIVGQFVITIVDNPERVLSECARVLKPGGQIILVNYLYSETGVAAAIERWASHYVRPLGLRPDFPLARLQAWAKKRQDITLLDHYKVPPFGVFTLIRFGQISLAEDYILQAYSNTNSH
jgi:phosphatidylethanolamine/phosphatidyl-N-methylethanolamine N-methyltransferase